VGQHPFLFVVNHCVSTNLLSSYVEYLKYLFCVKFRFALKPSLTGFAPMTRNKEYSATVVSPSGNICSVGPTRRRQDSQARLQRVGLDPK